MFVSRADMESASSVRQSLQAAGKLPEELSASNDVGCTRLAMMVDQSRRKLRWGHPPENSKGPVMRALAGFHTDQAGRQVGN